MNNTTQTNQDLQSLIPQPAELVYDKYDAAIEYLTAHPEEIRMAWKAPVSHEAGCLFEFAAKPGTASFFICGCLTMVRKSDYKAATPELTAAIRADHRIPNRPDDITVPSLYVFAEWQRRLDKELGRE